MCHMTPSDQERALALAAAGRTMRQIAGELRCHVRDIYQQLAKNAAFERRFARARKEGLELLADDLITISDEQPDVNRAKLKSDNVRWLLARRLPGQYGDRLAVDVSHSIDLRAALQGAEVRLRSVSDQRAPALVHDAEFSEVSPAVPADPQSAKGGIYE